MEGIVQLFQGYNNSSHFIKRRTQYSHPRIVYKSRFHIKSREKSKKIEENRRKSKKKSKIIQNDRK